MFFVTEIVDTSRNKHGERSIRKGGYATITSAARAALQRGKCFVRDDRRNIVAQSFNPDLPRYVKEFLQ